MKIKNRENGQAIVLIAIAFIVLVAFAGLAIDGGMVYSDRRHAQNASDAGSLAGGGVAALYLENHYVNYKNFNCTSSDVRTAIDLGKEAAIDQMIANGYTHADFSVETICNQGSTNFQHYIDITTTITKDTKSALIQVVYDGPLRNVVDATTRLKPRHPLAYGNAIVALNPEVDCDDSSAGGLKFGGTGNTDINGGGAWSDGCLVSQGDCNIQVKNGEILYHGGKFGSCPILEPNPSYADEKMPEDSYLLEDGGPQINCSDPNARTLSSISIHGHEIRNLDSEYDDNVHLICLTSTGNAINMTGGVLTSTLKTIYLQNGGDIQINGGIVTMSGPAEGQSPGLPGVIIYGNPEHEGVIDITGNISSTYTGLIYAPTYDVKISGTGDIGPTYNTQIIGYNVSLLGTARIDINFNDSWVLNRPTSLDLEE